MCPILKMCRFNFANPYILKLTYLIIHLLIYTYYVRTQGKIDLRNESGRPMKVKVVGGVSEK